MRLNQLSDKESKDPPKSANTPDEATLAALKDIMHDMHKTMLVADTLMRKLEGIIGKY